MEKKDVKKFALISAVLVGGMGAGYGIGKFLKKRDDKKVKEYLENVGPQYEGEKSKVKTKRKIVPWEDIYKSEK